MLYKDLKAGDLFTVDRENNETVYFKLTVGYSEADDIFHLYRDYHGLTRVKLYGEPKKEGNL